ncbi:serine/threonine protein kinase [Methanothermococcus sp. SCGC AD-155-C09]|nr:serine/threonine protein kinase [Methanothermococcus sp. SCGC AD-155-C09]
MLEEIKRETLELKTIMKGEGYYKASKGVMEDAIKEIERNNFKKAMNLLKNAKDLALKEKDIVEKLEGLKIRIKIEGKARTIVDSIIDKIRNGDLDNAKNLIPELEKTINRENSILKKIGEVDGLINKKLPGSNTKEAKELRERALNVLKKGQLNETEELIKKAELAAKPTPDYLLQRAKNFALNAENSFKQEKFEESINLWKKSIEEYERVKEAARERGDEDLIKDVKIVQEKIGHNIENAEVAIDNREMLKIVSRANEYVDKGNKSFSSKNYDEALNNYKRAVDLFNSALDIAKKRNFEREKIMEGLKSVKESIEHVKLEKGESLIEVDVEDPKSEKKLYSALKYLRSLDVEDKERLEELIVECSENIIALKVRNAERMMAEAEKLFNSAQYYDAREKYQNVWQYLNGVEDEAVSLNATSKISYIQNLRDACDKNITQTRRALVDVGEVKPEIYKVNDVKRGVKIEVKKKVEGFIKDERLESLREEYESLEYIGSGGFAQVYKGKRKGDGSVVALKIPENLTRETERIFFNELENWRKLNHRNIVRLIEPRLNPFPHLVLEYVEGGNLPEKRMGIEEACRIINDVARGIEYAHSQYVIHGDLTPKNILLKKIGRFYEAKITDFGLAVAATRSRSIKGLTPPYSAPEQLRGKVGEKTDVYQLGLLLYIMLTGFNPFNGSNSAEVEDKVKNYIPEPPSKYNKNAEGLDNIVMRCLSKDPEERPSVREFRETVYEFMKKEYGISIHLTKDYKTLVEKSLGLAFYHAKEGDLISCLKELKSAESKIRDEKLKWACRNLIGQIEYMIKEDIKGESVVEEIEKFLRLVG